MIENKHRNQKENASLAVAEDSREEKWKSKSFLGAIFMGDLDMEMAFPFPEQDEADKAAGDEILARVKAWADEELDGDQIDLDQEIPAHVWRGMADLGLFGIKIPKKYGGLGLSQTNYMRILGLLATYCGSVSATLSAHQSIGVPQPLKLFGTDAQKEKYLPRFARGEVSAFALTEPSVGSDPANMMTVAEKDEEGNWILNGEKLWCTNGVVADVLVVMARTPSIMKNGREVSQITAFIVEGDSPGIEVMHRCRFLGLRAIENGLIRFTNVKVPAENVIWGEGKGLRLALTTLNDGRLSIPAVCATASQAAVDFCARWGKSREQWGKAIGMHEAGASRLSYISAASYAQQALSDYCAALSDSGDVDIRMEAAAAKMFNTEVCWRVMDEAMQMRAGRGYETERSLAERGESSFPLERALRDTRINRIVEGTTDVMHLFLAREALDPHLRVTGTLFKKNATLGDKIKTLLRCAVSYSGWYPKLYLGGIFKWYLSYDRKLAAHLRWVERRSRKLARTLFHQMLLQGPKLEMRQNILARVVEIGTALGVMAIVASRAQGQLRSGDETSYARALYWLDRSRIEVDGLFSAIRKNTDAQSHGLARRLMDEAESLPEVTTDHLQALERELGRDLTSGAIQARPFESQPAPNAAK